MTVSIKIPSSKSYTNRALVMAALTKGTVCILNPLYCDDTEAMISCLQALGLHIETALDHIFVHDDISTVSEKQYELFARDSGTTLRFLVALLCLVPGTKIIRGNPRLSERPIKDLVDVLIQLGAKISYLEEENKLPLKIESSSLYEHAQVMIQTSMSSQFLSALLLLAPHFHNLSLYPQGVLISKPYVDMTINMMQEWGIDVIKQPDANYHIAQKQQYQMKRYKIEGDFSSASYFFASAALTRSSIKLKNLERDSVQADCQFLHILAEMGNQYSYENDGLVFMGKAICPVKVNMQNCPDQIPTLAVLAAFSDGVTTIEGISSLRLKECDRVHAIKNELSKMGIRVDEKIDSLTIYGGMPHAATIATYGDHRIAMAFAVASKRLPEMKIEHPEVVTKTFPTFWQEFKKL